MTPAEDSGPDIDPDFVDRLRSIMSNAEPRDLGFVEPPEGLWDRIVAATSAAPEGGAGTMVEYAIDRDDVVIRVGRDWASFARATDAPELVEPQPERTLWSYFDSDEVRDLWRMLVERVRSEGVPARVPLRCDAAGVRRWFDMTITPGPDDVVHFSSALTFEQPRDEVTLLAPEVERDAGAPVVPVCCWCAKGHDGDEWLEIEEIVRNLRLLEHTMPSVDYGICSGCRDLMSSERLVGGHGDGPLV